jgi:hypothetical protein
MSDSQLRDILKAAGKYSVLCTFVFIPLLMMPLNSFIVQLLDLHDQPSHPC